MKLSIVTTLYNSAPYIKEFYDRIKNETNNINLNYEIIFVNDGSPDNSLEIAKNIQIQDNKVSIIDLSRNFGHHRAMITGLSYTSGDYIFLIDCDLEEEPELLSKFLDQIQKDSDLDVIYGVQKTRKGGFNEKWTGALFYKTLNFLSDIKITENVILARIMSRRYLNNLLKHTERELSFFGIAAMTGFKQETIIVNKKNKGSTTYSLKKKINLAINYITSLTSKPLVYIFYLGLSVTALSLVYLVYSVCEKLLFGIDVQGWISIMISIWFFGGLIIFCLGIIGMYLSKIFLEVKKRPYSIVKSIYSNDIHNIKDIL